MKQIIKKLLILFYIAAYLICIWLGIEAGNLMFEMNSKIIKNVNTGYYKKILNSSFPVMNIIYNSGSADSLFSVEIKNIIRNVFGFSPDMPLTIFNSEKSFFYYYYNISYLPYIEEQREKSRELEQKTGTINRIVNNEEDKKKEIQQKVPDKELDNYFEPASSIYFDEIEKKDMENTDKITKGNIEILNETDYNIDIEKLLNEPLKIKFDKNGPKVLIFHTHTTEGYLQKPEFLEKDDISSWSRDNRYNVVRVGEEIADELRGKYGIEVIHNTTVHDYPDYNSSYGKSLQTVSSILKSYPSIKIVLDIHRDAVGHDEPKLRVLNKIDGRNVAKMMFVLGTNSKKLPHPNWMENLKLAVKLQQNLNEQNPELARHIYISGNRYNQHLSDGALIIEVGGDGNTIDEAVLSAQYIAEAINNVVNKSNR